jgi:hypothetical protein
LFVKSELDRKLPTNLHDLPLKDDVWKAIIFDWYYWY